MSSLTSSFSPSLYAIFIINAITAAAASTRSEIHCKRRSCGRSDDVSCGIWDHWSSCNALHTLGLDTKKGGPRDLSWHAELHRLYPTLRACVCALCGTWGLRKHYNKFIIACKATPFAFLYILPQLGTRHWCKRLKVPFLLPIFPPNAIVFLILSSASSSDIELRYAGSMEVARSNPSVNSMPKGEG